MTLSLIEDAVRSTGQPVRIRLATPGDFESIKRFYEQLSDPATYYRFFGTRRRLPDAELREAAGGDLVHHVTLLAIVDDELVGIGEYVTNGEPEAEVAFSVADDHHGEGIATLLLERLAIMGAERGLRRLTARTLPDNRDMRLVFRTVGLAADSRFDGGEVEYSLSLADLTALHASAAARYAQAVTHMS